MAQQGPQARTLSEEEFTAIEDRLLAEAPAGLSERDLDRWIEPRLEQAVAEQEYGRRAEPEGSALGRGLAGLGEMLNPIEAAKGLYQAVRHPLDTISGLAEAQVAQFPKAAQAATEGRYSEAIGHFGAGVVPVLGPIAAHVGEEIGATGDVARGVGRGVGLVAPFAVKPAVQAARGAVSSERAGKAASALERGAAARVVDVMAPKVGPNKTRFGGMAEGVADDVVKTLKAEGAPWSREGLQDVVVGKLGEAELGLDAANDARLAARSFPTAPLIAGLESRLAQLTAHAEEASAATRKASTRPSAIVDASGQPFTVTERTARPHGTNVVPSPNQPRASVIQQAIDELKALGPSARYEDIRRIRQAYDGPAKAVYSPSMTADYLKAQGGKLGAADVTGTLRDALADMDPATAKANAPYALWRKANDVLEATAEVERTRPTRGRQIAARVLATFGGAQAGGPAGAAAGFALAPLFEVSANVTPKLQTARLMSQLADAIRKGDLGRVMSYTEQLKAAAKKAAPTTVREVGRSSAGLAAPVPTPSQ